MKYLFFTACLLFYSFNLSAQTSGIHDSLVTSQKLDSFTKVEIESEFPGGIPAWNRFLSNTLVYPPKAVRKKIERQVVARFIVEKNGEISNIEIVSGPKELWNAVLDALHQSPRWIPASTNGKKLKSYKMQPFNFKLVPA
jgi:protein TonB